MNEFIPEHSSRPIGSFLPPGYFWPPSTPTLPVLNVTAFFRGAEFHYHRKAHGEPWKRTH